MKLRDIVKTENIIRLSPNEPLSSTLSHLASSHDAAFIFEGDDFKGLVNPYQCVIKTSYPGNAKTQNCLVHPPRVHLNDPIARIAEQMSSTRLHYLPVFDEKENFAGIVSARRLLDVYQNSAFFNRSISEVLKAKNRPLITIFEDDTLSHALALFKLEKVSKLVVVNRNNRLRGLLSHYDLIAHLVAPKEKENKGEKNGIKTSFRNQKVKNFAKNYVLTLSEKDTMAQALKLILEKKIGSIVIMNENKFPIGIITTRDFLFLLKKTQPEKPIEVTSKNLSRQSSFAVRNFFEYLRNWLKKVPEVSKAKLLVKEEKNGGLFRVVLSLIPHKGASKVFEKEGKDLPQILEKVKHSHREIPKKMK